VADLGAERPLFRIFYALRRWPLDNCSAPAHGTRRIQYPACIFLLIALFCLRRQTFVFDARQRIVRWNGLRILKVYSGSMPFSDITGIGTETMPSQHGQPMYRMTLLTAHGSTPLSDGYGAGGQWFEKMRETIDAFIHLERADVSGHSVNSGDSQLDASIRSMLTQGRRIDAITLVRQSENLDLTRAVQRVNDLEKRL
jgi:hypothetical protein